jgi:putative drug exporter of the RND superfamily
MAHQPRNMRNLAGGAGAWSARHRWTAVGLWLVFVFAAIAIGNVVGTTQTNGPSGEPGQAGRADRVLHAAGFDAHASELVLVQSKSLTVGNPAFRAAVNGTIDQINATGLVQDVRSPLTAMGAGATTSDGHSALIRFSVKGDSDTADSRISPVLAAVSRSQQSHPELRIEEFGDASANKALNKALGGDLRRAEVLSLPISLVILFFAFGALVAALLPVGLAFTAFLAAAGLLAPLSKLIHTNQTASTVMLLVGMAVGVDYSLFYLRREREERRSGHSPEQSLATAAATSGRSVLVSGLTVVVAMAGMFLAGDSTFSAVAEATILVVLVAVAGSVSVLPALLSLLGDRVDRGRLWSRRRKAVAVAYPGDSRGRWDAIVGSVLRRPARSAALAMVVLVALAIPALGMRTASPGATDIPASLPIMQTYARIQQAFPGGAGPAKIVVQARDVTAAPVTKALQTLQTRALASGEARAPFTIDVNPAHTVAVASVGLIGNGTDRLSSHALSTLRHDIVPAAFAGSGASWVGVSGQTAQSVDSSAQLQQALPLVTGFVLALAFLLLLFAFRSLVVPLLAIALNLLSVAAAYGVLVLVFQHSWAQGILDFTSTGTIANWLPLFLFALLFGLSMDYHVFILSRIKEGHDRGLDNAAAIREGVRATAGVITSAAGVMVAVFAIFATLSQVSIKQAGVGLGVAVLVDATIVRTVLLPATMAMLGERNWYLPGWLQWLPRVGRVATVNSLALQQQLPNDVRESSRRLAGISTFSE